MYKLIIFDLDGTLADTLQDLADAVNYALDVHGFPIHPLESFRYFVGNGVPKLIERAVPEEKRNTEILESVKKDFSYYYNIHSLDKTESYRGITDMLKLIKKMGISTAVATNKSEEFVNAILQKLFPEFRFDAVMGGVENMPKKPDPAIVHKILSVLKIRHDEAVFAGDSDVDVHTAKNAGMKSIGCLWGFRDYNELEKAGADHIVSKPSEIVEILNGQEDI